MALLTIPRQFRGYRAYITSQAQSREF